MPGPVSDAYDPEWGTADTAHQIREALEGMHKVVSNILGNKPPMYIGNLVHMKDGDKMILGCALTEKQWRLLRFACERAAESI